MKLLARVSASALSTPDDMAACILTPEMGVIGGPVHFEELEADAETLARPQARRFLQTCLVPAAEVEQAITRASAIAAGFGTALLCVELAATTATVTVSKPRPVGRSAAPALRV